MIGDVKVNADFVHLPYSSPGDVKVSNYYEAKPTFIGPDGGFLPLIQSVPSYRIPGTV